MKFFLVFLISWGCLHGQNKAEFIRVEIINFPSVYNSQILDGYKVSFVDSDLYPIDTLSIIPDGLLISDVVLRPKAYKKYGYGRLKCFISNETLVLSAFTPSNIYYGYFSIKQGDNGSLILYNGDATIYFDKPFRYHPFLYNGGGFFYYMFFNERLFK